MKHKNIPEAGRETMCKRNWYLLVDKINVLVIKWMLCFIEVHLKWILKGYSYLSIQV